MNVVGQQELNEAPAADGAATKGGVNGLATARGREAELRRVLAERAISPLFQPIVDLRSRETVGHEALARGPAGSELESPARLFEAAEAAGKVGELDWTCRVRALERVAEAGVDPGAAIFINAEPETLAGSCPLDLRERWLEGHPTTFVEITERALTSRPAELFAAVDRIRERGWGVALDDVGSDVRSLALMPLLRPDVIKLDLRLVQDRPSAEHAMIVNAVRAEQERTGAYLLAEGVENEEHLEIASALGATLAQGWLFGRPAALERGGLSGALHSLPQRTASAGATPYRLIAPQREVRQASKRLLLTMSMELERLAEQIGEGAVVLSAFQNEERFTPQTIKRYERLARRAALVGAFGVGMPREPAERVRGATLEGADPLADEWSVIVLGPHFAGALVAVDLGDEGPEPERRFDYAITYERELVVDAAMTLVRRIAPRR